MTGSPVTPASGPVSKYRHVFFDVDSTLVSIEGIDVLANDDPRIAALTEAAMNGEVPLDEVYARRLEMIRPSLESVTSLGARYIGALQPGAVETLAALREAGSRVRLVTAGIRQAVLILAAHIGVSPADVHAVALEFDDQGNYRDFDRRSYLARSGGKELVVRDLRARTHGKAAFVGDGVSDLETKEVVDLFIGYGGVQARPRVKENAHVFVPEADLRALLPYLVQ